MDYEPVESSMIEALGYDAERQQMGVRFKGGKTFLYHEVPSDCYETLRSSDSVGKQFHASVAGQYRSTAG